LRCAKHSRLRAEFPQLHRWLGRKDGKFVPMIRIAMMFISRGNLGLGRKQRAATYAGNDRGDGSAFGGSVSAEQYSLGQRKEQARAIGEPNQTKY
jgi:hypothetical protein